MGVQFTQVSFKPRGGAGALHEVTFEASSGVVALLGAPGAGQSSLLALAAALEKPSSGVVQIDGCDARKQATQVRRRVGYLPSEGDLLPDLTVYEILDYLALLSNLEQPQARELRISRALERFDLVNYRERRIRTLSPGIRRMVVLAQAGLGQISTLLLDSPTRDLSAADAWLVRTAIAAVAREYLVLFATNSAAEAQAVADRVLVFENGRILADHSLPALLALVRGQVWTFELDGPPPARLAPLIPSGLSRNGNRTLVRGLAPTCPQAGATPAEPTLEDAYVWILARAAGTFAQSGETIPAADPVGTAERIS